MSRDLGWSSASGVLALGRVGGKGVFVVVYRVVVHAARGLRSQERDGRSEFHCDSFRVRIAQLCSYWKIESLEMSCHGKSRPRRTSFIFVILGGLVRKSGVDGQ